MNKSKAGIEPRKFLASGGNIKNFKGSKGLNSQTIPNLKSNKK